jgi:hypothetical protein
MQVMVINDDPEVQVRVAKGLMSKGFQVVGMETVARACAYVKIDPVDILITGERVGGRLSHTVALAAECANPMVTTMLLTDRTDPEIEELYELLPSLYALISPRSDPAIVARLALSAVASPEDAERRMRRNAEARQTQPMADWAAVFQDSPVVARSLDEDDWDAPEGPGGLADPDPDAFLLAPRAETGVEAGREMAPHIDPSGPVSAWAESALPRAAVPEPEIVAWGDTDEVLADPAPQAEPQPLPEPAPAAAAWHVDPAPMADSFDHAFADLIRNERRMEALRSAARQVAPEGAVPLNPLFAPAAVGQGAALPQVRARPVIKPLPVPSSQPEVVPARQVRTDWMVPKIRERDGAQADARSRLHLA